MPAKIEWHEITDGKGQHYRLPHYVRVMDCAGCGTLLTREFRHAGSRPNQPKLLSGHLFDRHAHPRPYCLECYLRVKGVSLHAMGVTDGSD
jgi:hypothetical protein